MYRVKNYDEINTIKGKEINNVDLIMKEENLDSVILQFTDGSKIKFSADYNFGERVTCLDILKSV